MGATPRRRATDDTVSRAVAAAQAEADAIAALGKGGALETLENTYLIPAAEVLQIAQHVVLARIAQRAAT